MNPNRRAILAIFLCLVLFFLFFSSYCSASTTYVSNSFISQQRDSMSSPTQKTARDVMETSSVGGNFAASDFLNIKRDITPNYKNYYLKNKANIVKTEIQGCSRQFNDILILENIDRGLNNISDFHIYIEDPFDSNRFESNISKQRKINEFKIDLNDTDRSVYEQMGKKYAYAMLNNTIYIHVPILKSGENIKYEYRIQSNNTGIFDIITRLRLDGSIWQDLEKVNKIEIGPPEVAVGIEKDQSYAIKGKKLNITYDIIYKSGWCKDPIYFNINFANSTEYNIFYENGTTYNYAEQINRTFSPLEITKHAIQVEYKNPGLHPIPILNIENASVTQEKIDIDVYTNEWTKFLQDNAVLLSAMAVLISIIALLISIIDISMAREEIKAIIRDVSIYEELRDRIKLEIFIFITISVMWIFVNVVFIYPFSFLLLISIPLILIIALWFQFELIKKYKN